MSYLYDKITEKIKHPFNSVELTRDEVKVCEYVKSLLANLKKAIEHIDIVIDKFKIKIQKTIDDKEEALYHASFGNNRPIFEQMISYSAFIINHIEKFKEYNKIIDVAIQDGRKKQVGKINNLLEELNVNYKLVYREKKLYIQLPKLQPKEWNKQDNTSIVSEGERRILALAYFLYRIQNNTENKTIVIDDPISSLDHCRKYVIAYKIYELMSQHNNQVIVLSHDIGFVEKMRTLMGRLDDSSYLELHKNNLPYFEQLCLEEYLKNDEMIYMDLINTACNSADHKNKLVALMSLRPFTTIRLQMDTEELLYKNVVEKKTTYFSHSIYAQSKRVLFNEETYKIDEMRKLIKSVNIITHENFDLYKLIPDDFIFEGFTYENAWELYTYYGLNNLRNARIKAIILRVVLETTLFAIISKEKLDPERIGKQYERAAGDNMNSNEDKRKYVAKLKRLYDMVKKYHHGTDGKSTIGISEITFDEMCYYDNEITEIHKWIEEHKVECNPNLFNDYVVFCNKWISLIKNNNERDFNISFGDACFNLSFRMDSFESLDDKALLGSMLFSQWRYLTHCSMGADFSEYSEWFIIVLEQLRIISS